MHEVPPSGSKDSADELPLRWTILLSVAPGGLLNGILLHQVLQWHHLLSLWNEEGELRWHVP